MRRRALVLALVVAAGCTLRNPNYCENDLDCENGCNEVTHTCNPPIDAGPPDARIDCTEHTQCAAWCDPDTNRCAPCETAQECADRGDSRDECNDDGECVECLEHDDCQLDAPVCSDGLCGPCDVDEDCEARDDVGEIGVCRPDGSCLGDAGAIFVQQDGDCSSADGSRQLPYCEVHEAVAVADLDRSVIIVRAGSYEPFTVTDKALRIHGRDDGLLKVRIDSGNSDETRVTVQGLQADVLFRNLVFAGATVNPAIGLHCIGNATCRIDRCVIDNNARGIYANGAELIDVRRSVVRGNQYGGLQTNSTPFFIENTSIYRNGSSATTFGGAFLDNTLPGTTRVFRYNTVFDNYTDGNVTSTGGVVCDNEPATLTSSIVWANEGAEVSPLCQVAHSVIDDATIGATPTNSAANPQFEDPLAPEPDLHLTSGSPAISNGDPNDSPAVDLDGQPRDATPDSGAYEHLAN